LFALTEGLQVTSCGLWRNWFMVFRHCIQLAVLCTDWSLWRDQN